MLYKYATLLTSMALIKVFYCLIAQKILSNSIKRSFKRHKLTLNHSNVVIVVTMQFITKNDSIGPFVDVFYTFKISILSIMCIIRMIVTMLMFFITHSSKRDSNYPIYKVQ